MSLKYEPVSEPLNPKHKVGSRVLSWSAFPQLLSFSSSLLLSSLELGDTKVYEP